MISIEDINSELRSVDTQVSESSYGIRHIGELAMQSLSRAQSEFSDQQAGRTLINALSLIQASCNDAANSVNQVSVESKSIISRLQQ
jgi:hypothetical protein